MADDFYKLYCEEVEKNEKLVKENKYLKGRVRSLSSPVSYTHLCGSIRIGAKGDLLVFQAQDLHELFHSFGKKRLHRIIHEGVHIWPHVII